METNKNYFNTKARKKTNPKHPNVSMVWDKNVCWPCVVNIYFFQPIWLLLEQIQTTYDGNTSITRHQSLTKLLIFFDLTVKSHKIEWI